MSTQPDPAFWAGRRVLVTGHTGFKGSWLSLWLDRLGAHVTGLALDPPTEPSLFEEASVREILGEDLRVDIRDGSAVRAAMREAAPEIVIHMAAQSLVRRSYADPLESFETNVIGTANVLEAVRESGSVRVVVNVTTDKVYENDGRTTGYPEDAPIGGHDPYSASKAAADLVGESYRRSFLAERGVALANARAGNVIGGGDRAVDRLVPDMIAAFSAGAPVVIRNPGAVRPWQHVLEPLSGYLVLAERLSADPDRYAGAWNFGPPATGLAPVRVVVELLAAEWGDGASWSLDTRAHPAEAAVLTLDASKTRAQLGWAGRWPLDRAVGAVAEWERGRLAGRSARDLCLAQIDAYLE